MFINVHKKINDMCKNSLKRKVFINEHEKISIYTDLSLSFFLFNSIDFKILCFLISNCSI